MIKKLKNLWRNQPKNLGKLHEDKTGILKQRSSISQINSVSFFHPLS